MKAKKRRELHDRITAQIPFLQHEDWVTPEKDLRAKDLRWLTGAPRKVFRGDPRTYANAVSQQCHAAAAHAWLTNPGWTLVLGFACMESMCGLEWHFHSFCLDENGTVVEPTPLTRDQYWGVPLDRDTAAEVAEEETVNFAKLGLSYDRPSQEVTK